MAAGLDLCEYALDQDLIEKQELLVDATRRLRKRRAKAAVAATPAT